MERQRREDASCDHWVPVAPVMATRRDPWKAARCAAKAVASLVAADECESPVRGALSLWTAHMRVVAARTLLLLLRVRRRGGGAGVSEEAEEELLREVLVGWNDDGSREDGWKDDVLLGAAKAHIEAALPVVEVALGPTHHAAVRGRRLKCELELL